MEELSIHSRPSTNQTGPRSSGRRCPGAVGLCLGLLSVFLLAGLFGLGVHYYFLAEYAAEELSTIKTKLNDLIQDSIPEEDKTCPAGWIKFSYFCYFFSTKSGSWEDGREDCKRREADLVVINSAEKQRFVSELTRNRVWIGLNDLEKEGTWTWIDGTPLTFKNWDEGEPNNNLQSMYMDEDCAEINVQKGYRWNDLYCENHLQWICEKKGKYW